MSASTAMAGAVPPQAPLAMPTRALDAPGRPRRHRAVSGATRLARLVTFVGTIVLTGFGTGQMIRVVAPGSSTALEIAFVALFAITFGWISLSACAAVAGIVAAAMRRGTGSAPAVASTVAPTGSPGGTPGDTADAPIAIVMPIYNEDPAPTCAALETMATGLAAEGRAREFELFLLSDTTRAEVRVAETAAVHELRTRLRDTLAVWYRRRPVNTARKAGNLRDFVERWGARYEAMIVLDADSLIAAPTLLALADGLRADTNLGILQSVPTLADGEALFARLQQFAGSVYGPVVSRGLAAWQGDDGNYWGHNAIIRTAAFADACGLPTLAGRRPFGGDVLSHDFVEAAMIRKAGWSVRMLPELAGSWENSPPSLLDVAVRDRRWAQGNVQHLAVVGARDLAWPSRVHFLTGVMSYVASLLWLCLIAAGLILTVQALVHAPRYFDEGASLFPTWPVFDAERMRALFGLSMLVLLVPKLAGAVRVLASRARRTGHGGGPRFVASLSVEVLLSALYAPVLMLLQTRQLVEIALGRDSGWDLQRRTSEGLPWSVVWRRHAVHVATGAILAVALGWLSPMLLAWMSPIVAGLLLAAPLSRWSADARLGRRLARAGLLLVPEEVVRPAPFVARDACLPRYETAVAAASVAALLRDPAPRRVHADLTGRPPAAPRGRPDRMRLSVRAKLDEADSADELLGWLESAELNALLDDPDLLDRAARLDSFPSRAERACA